MGDAQGLAHQKAHQGDGNNIQRSNEGSLACGCVDQGLLLEGGTAEEHAADNEAAKPEGPWLTCFFFGTGDFLPVFLT